MTLALTFINYLLVANLTSATCRQLDGVSTPWIETPKRTRSSGVTQFVEECTPATGLDTAWLLAAIIENLIPLAVVNHLSVRYGRGGAPWWRR